MFAILVIMALFTTFITTPAVMMIYKPVPDKIDENHQSSSKAETATNSSLRILACIRAQPELPSITSLVNSYTTATSTMKLYVVRLVELTDRSSSIVMARRTRKNGLPCVGRFRAGDFNDHVAAAFRAHHHQQWAAVRVKTATSVSTLATMHEDICHVAKTKRAGMVILPFHKQRKREDDQETVEINLGQGWRGVNERVLREARCSVAVLVDRGFGLGPVAGSSESDHLVPVKRVCVVFLGGPDSREALRSAGLMVDNPRTKVSVIRYNSLPGGARDGPIKRQSPEHKITVASTAEKKGEELDEEAVMDFIRRWDGTAEYVEKKAGNLIEELLAVGKSGDFDLLVVGKGRFAEDIAAEVAGAQAEYQELGPVGGVLASSGHGMTSSLLVVQHRESAFEGSGNNCLKMSKCGIDL